MDKHTAPVREAITAPLAETGFVVEDVTAHAAGRFRTLTVVIDREAGTEPVSLDDITTATRVISAAIDELPLFNDHPYDLQVTSPGATRALTSPRHFRRVIGRTLALRTEPGTEFEGVLLAVHEDPAPEAVVRLADGSERAVPLSEIAHAEVVLQFR